MSTYRRLEVSQVPGATGEVTVARLTDHRIIDTSVIEELGSELFDLAERKGNAAIVLNFSQVEFLSSATLNKLVRMNEKVKSTGGRLRLCGIRPVLLEPFTIAGLDRRLEIKSTQDEALQGL
jgi:anti-sigma B factor antagonist